jgi:hypothetical protein
MRPELRLGFLVGFGDVTRGVDADRPVRLAELPKRLAEELRERANRAGGPPMIASMSEKP